MKKALIIIIALAAVSACGPKTTETVAEQEEKGRSVVVEPARKQTVSHEQTYSSTVIANVVNNIAPQSAGRIRSISAEIGDFVSKGQVLAEMDRVQLDQAELRLKNQQDEFKRLGQLFMEGGVSRSDYEASELQLRVAQSSYNNLEENTILRSPVEGVVTARNYDLGDMYTMAQPLFTVQQITPVKMLVGVSESDYTKVAKGDRVTVRADALPGKSFTGTIVRLYPTMDAASHTFSVEVQVRNENRLLRPGMYARVEINFGDSDAIVVPDFAVQKLQGAGQRFVFVASEDGTAKQKIVTLGRHDGSAYEILSGLEEGDPVIVKGGSALKAGDKVEVVEQ